MTRRDRDRWWRLRWCEISNDNRGRRSFRIRSVERAFAIGQGLGSLATYKTSRAPSRRHTGLTLGIKDQTRHQRPDCSTVLFHCPRGTHKSNRTQPLDCPQREYPQRPEMLSVQTICLLAPLAAVLISDKCLAHPSIRQRQEARPLCEGCGNQCDKCEYGVTISALCGIPECRRGPGEICGGPSETWGVCGDGLSCNCNRCSGCSLDTLACFPNLCQPHQSLEARHLDMVERFPIIQ